MFLVPDGTMFVQLLNFAIFFALLNVLFLRPVGNAIRKRRDYINGVTHDYDRYQAEGNALRAQAEELRAHARRDAEHTLARARAEASNATSEIATRYSRQVEAAIAEAQHAVQGEIAMARANEPKLVRDLADAMLDRTLSEAAK